MFCNGTSSRSLQGVSGSPGFPNLFISGRIHSGSGKWILTLLSLYSGDGRLQSERPSNCIDAGVNMNPTFWRDHLTCSLTCGDTDECAEPGYTMIELMIVVAIIGILS